VRTYICLSITTLPIYSNRIERIRI
jgi:hypothetical protein